MSKYQVSLRVTHPTMRSEEVTKALDLTPTFSYSVGDKKMTPKGTEIPGWRKETYWCCEVQPSAETVENEIARHATSLLKRRELLSRIVEEGGRVEYFVGWFSAENSGFVLPHTLLQALANLRIDLSFDIYPSGHSQAAP